MGRMALVLLSGGLDSATALAYALDRGYRVATITFSYGQRHRIELVCAELLASKYKVKNDLIRLPPRLFAHSPLTGEGAVPKDRLVGGIAPTYVPARNMVFLTLALAYAEPLRIRHLFIGANAVDYSGYPDCRGDFLSSWLETANLGTAAGRGRCKFHLHAPLLRLNKAQIIKKGLQLGVNYALTSSCYDPEPVGGARWKWRPCSRCEACLLRAKGFAAAKVEDPLCPTG